MSARKMSLFAALSGLLLLIGCAASQVSIPVDKNSVMPGTAVAFNGSRIDLAGKAIAVGAPLPSVTLIDSATLSPVDISTLKGDVLFLNIVPSLDTKVCEAQTHYLGEAGSKMPSTVKRIVISRDSPFAQMRFAREAKLTDFRYLSDQAQGAFGNATGLLMGGGLMLDTRTVIVTDRMGTVRYIQVVPEITHLPDMEKAFQQAIELAR